jgi:hypothetical protein
VRTTGWWCDSVDACMWTGGRDNMLVQHVLSLRACCMHDAIVTYLPMAVAFMARAVACWHVINVVDGDDWGRGGLSHAVLGQPAAAREEALVVNIHTYLSVKQQRTHLCRAVKLQAGRQYKILNGLRLRLTLRAPSQAPIVFQVRQKAFFCAARVSWGSASVLPRFGPCLHPI